MVLIRDPSVVAAHSRASDDVLGWAGAGWQAVSAAIGRFAERRRYRHGFRRIEDLPPILLCDIGLRPEDVEAARTLPVDLRSGFLETVRRRRRHEEERRWRAHARRMS